MKDFFLSFCFFLILTFSFTACSFSSSASQNSQEEQHQSFTLVTWNVQTFFDAENTGTEYDEFLKKGVWTVDKYNLRLKNLCEVIKTLNADIYVLEEIENEGVLVDISNQFAYKAWNQSDNWNYTCFSKENGSSIGCAIISKYPLSCIKTHSLDIRSEAESQPSLRPIMQATCTINSKNIDIFVNHWKSKAGNEESSGIWRQWQESVLAQLLQDSTPAILCGDFNEDIKEFSFNQNQNEKENIILKSAQIETGKVLKKVYSPWLNQNNEFTTETGSYFYNQAWERIDHIFSSGDVQILNFSPKAQSPWADENKIPVKYLIYSGTGYSDHLPLMATIQF